MKTEWSFTVHVCDLERDWSISLGTRERLMRSFYEHFGRRSPEEIAEQIDILRENDALTKRLLKRWSERQKAGAA